MRKLICITLLTLVASSAAAFTNDELLATVAMPLAVDAVSNVNGVPQTRLADLVAQLNQANVPPTQFVEVIRYVPVALVPQPNQTDLDQFVRDQIAQGVTGDALVNAIVQQLSSNYNVTPQLTLAEPATVVVERTDYIPQPVLASLGGTSDPLALVALPLAVAAVADMTGVPTDQLASLVATLNNANMPVAQEIQIVRYVPVALVDNGPQFVQFVQQQTSQGITGPALVPVVTQQLQTYYPQPAQIQVAAPAPTIITPEPPPVVVSRVEEMRRNPHGGPPGQLKKQLGLQTGAEVVHGYKPGRQVTPSSTPAYTPQPAVVQPQPRIAKEHGHGNGEGNGRGHGKHAAEMQPMTSAAPVPVPVQRPVVVPQPQAQPAPVMVPGGPGRGHGKGPEGGGPPGQAKGEGPGNGHGNGKGHGKD